MFSKTAEAQNCKICGNCGGREFTICVICSGRKTAFKGTALRAACMLRCVRLPGAPGGASRRAESCRQPRAPRSCETRAGGRESTQEPRVDKPVLGLSEARRPRRPVEPIEVSRTEDSPAGCPCSSSWWTFRVACWFFSICQEGPPSLS